MCKVNSFFIFLVLCLTSAQCRIWFVGDQMPGTNRTIPEEPTTTLSWAPPMNMDRVEYIIGRGVTRMALALERVTGNEVDNLIFAPISVAAALSVVLLGATGKTGAEIASFLGLLAGVDFTERTQIVHQNLGRYFTKFESNPGVNLGTQLAFANGVFVREGLPIQQKFDKMAREIYRCEVLPLDFLHHPDAARQVINKWVSNRTDGRINDVIPPNVSPMTSIIIVNAFYFNAQWEYPFSGGTKMGTFHVNKDQTISIPMMVNGADIPYYQTKEFRIFGMPYKGGDLFMYIVLPEKNLHKFVSDLTVESIENMIGLTKEQTVLYIVPRMKMTSGFDLRKPLQELGIRSLFDPSSKDLNGISEGVSASNVLHKVEIQVTETGTVAAASTAVSLNRGGFPIVKVDRPFLFFIYHNPTKTIIFWGSVFKPTPYLDP